MTCIDYLFISVTVDQTNMALRQMMLTLTSWREDNEKLRQDHKEKFQETRALVLKVCTLFVLFFIC